MYSVQRLERAEEWFAANAGNPAACKSMMTWLEAAMNGPREVAHGEIDRHDATGRRRRTLYFAIVPGTGAMITYTVLDAPVRLIVIGSVIPAP